MANEDHPGKPTSVPKGKKAVWVPGHWRLVKADKPSSKDVAPAKPKVQRKSRAVRPPSPDELVEVLVASRRPGADRAAKARAAKALNREVERRVAKHKGADPRRVRAGILGRAFGRPGKNKV